MTRSLPILTVLLLLILAPVAGAQTSPTCGVIGIDGPSELEQGEPLRLKAKVIGLTGTMKPELKWRVSTGIITLGQGTDEITIDTVGLGGQILTATMVLVAAPPGCTETASSTTLVKPPPMACGIAFDRYGDISFSDEKARLDNFAIQLMNQPLASGYLLMSAGQETFKGETAERLIRAKSYLVEVRGIDRNRVAMFDCGFSKDLNMQLYIVSPEAILPACTRDLIPLSEVKFTKPRPKSLKKRR